MKSLLTFLRCFFPNQKFTVEAPKQKNQKMISLLQHSMAAKIRGAAMHQNHWNQKITSFSKYFATCDQQKSGFHSDFLWDLMVTIMKLL